MVEIDKKGAEQDRDDNSAVKDHFFDESSGTNTMSNVTRDRICGLVAPVPPSEEQLRIADTVDTLMALCDVLEQHVSAAQLGAHAAPAGQAVSAA